MIIVSQNKRAIVNFDNLKTIELDRETNFTTINIFRETNEVETGVCGLYIGKYATEERAKEVLEEIAEQYEHEKACKCDRSYLATLDNFTYRMPRE